MKNSVYEERANIYSYNDLIEIRKYLSDISDLIYNEKLFSQLTDYDINKVKENAQNFYSDYFNLHDIYYVDKLYSERFNILRKINKKIITNAYEQNKIKSPFDLQINYGDKLEDCFVYTYNIPIYGKIISVFKNISLTNKNINNTITETYIHEICHTQIPTQTFGKLTNFNDELFPIFIELLYSINNQKNNMILSRLNNLNKSIKLYYEYHDTNMFEYVYRSIKYIESTLKAFMLLYLYDTETNASAKSRIIDDIQSIMDSNLSIKDFLLKYDINEKDYKSKKFISHYVR